ELVSYSWELRGPIGKLLTAEDESGAQTVRSSSAHVILHAADTPAEGGVRVVARSGEREVAAEADVEVVEETTLVRAGEGIPSPDFIHELGAPWRSRMLNERWQVNSGHRDYRLIA